MGTDISLIVKPISREITVENLFNKRIAIDAFNTIYQFLSIIKGADGKPLRNFQGKPTSHLSGLLYRNTFLLESGVKPVYCFDGIEKSKKLRWENTRRDDVNRVRINKYIIQESKKLLTLMGIPYVQGVAEGEAQCVKLELDGVVWAVASQDYDCLAFGSDRIVRNLSIGKKQKKGNTKKFVPIRYVSGNKFYEEYGIDRMDLINMSTLIGNDFYAGLKGFGVKRALHAMKNNNYVSEIPNLPLERKDGYVYSSKDELKEDFLKIREIFLNPKVEHNYKLLKEKPDYVELKNYMVFTHNFSSARMDMVVKRLKKIYENTKKQTSLGAFM